MQTVENKIETLKALLNEPCIKFKFKNELRDIWRFNNIKHLIISKCEKDYIVIFPTINHISYFSID